MSNQPSSNDGISPFGCLEGLDDLDLDFDVEFIQPTDLDELFDFVVAVDTALMPQFCVDCKAFVDQPSLHFRVLHPDVQPVPPEAQE